MVGGATALLVVGIPVVLVGLPMLRWIADRHRTLAAEALGHPVPTERRSVEGQHALRRLQTWAADPMSWRELAWAVVSTTVGLAISLTVVLLAVLRRDAGAVVVRDAAADDAPQPARRPPAEPGQPPAARGAGRRC